jgi:hypothetical protein
MDTKEARKPAARTSSIEEETVKKPSKPQHAYFAVRQCDFLKGPAIFFAWEDCSFYVDQNDDVEYQGFDLILDAVEWIHERAESVPPYPPLPMSPMNYHMRPPMMAKTPPKTAAGVGVDVTFDETASPPRSKAMTLTAEIAKTTAPKPTSRKRKRPTVNTDTVWEEQFQEMTRYKLEHGDCEIPSSTASPHLKKWIKRNREAFAKMKKVGKGDNSLQAQRLAKLTELGFNFTLKKPYPTWEERVEQYREYKTKHGKEPVKYSGDGLGNWVTLQRQRYRQLKKGEPSRLKQEKADQLTREGFTWDTGIKIAKFVHPRRSWDESYADLIAYKVRYNRLVLSIPLFSRTN